MFKLSALLNKVFVFGTVVLRPLLYHPHNISLLSLRKSEQKFIERNRAVQQCRSTTLAKQNAVQQCLKLLWILFWLILNHRKLVLCKRAEVERTQLANLNWCCLLNKQKTSHKNFSNIINFIGTVEYVFSVSTVVLRHCWMAPKKLSTCFKKKSFRRHDLLAFFREN